MQPTNNPANIGVNQPKKGLALPSHEQLVTTAARVLTELAEREQGKKPSPQAITILAKLMANRALRELKEGKTTRPPLKKARPPSRWDANQ